MKALCDLTVGEIRDAVTLLFNDVEETRSVFMARMLYLIEIDALGLYQYKIIDNELCVELRK